jgi:hypothetical protein
MADGPHREPDAFTSGRGREGTRTGGPGAGRPRGRLAEDMRQPVVLRRRGLAAERAAAAGDGGSASPMVSSRRSPVPPTPSAADTDG